MTRILKLSLAAMFLIAAACGSDDATDTADTDSQTEADTDDTMEDDTMEDDTMEDDTMEDDTMEDDAMAEHSSDLSIKSVNFDTVEVTIQNHSDAEIDLDGYYMCSFPTYAPIEGVGAVGPGESITITSTVPLVAADGELGLYTAEDFSNPEAIVAYVEWGSTGHERSTVASEAGVWDGKLATVDGSTLTVG